MIWKESWINLKRKTAALYKPRKKKRLAETEHELVVRIPPVLRLSMIAVQLQLIAIRVQVEHVRITITIRYIWSTINATTLAIPANREGYGLYFIRERNSSSASYQAYFFFRDTKQILRKKP